MENYLILKFGGFKGADFSNNPIAYKTLDEISDAEMSDDQEKVKELTCRMIDEFNGTIINWWEDRNFVSKDEAKEYVMNYERTKV